jgi:Rps23 Pro-64 3,4-dihydroxylase Tpa1-like proline 4-hydroxylase
MLNIERIENQTLQTQPYRWAFLDRLFTPADAAALAGTFPRDQFKNVSGYDGEKEYEYVARSLIHMGASAPTHTSGLSVSWQRLAADLLSIPYRAAMSRLTGTDLTDAPMEVNVVHYGAGARMGPHVDLRQKIVTQVLYFNETWNPDDGGCINILRSSDACDVAAQVPPIVGNSVALVRSDRSWHSVTRVATNCRQSRRSLNVIFHLPGSVSTMWPPGENAPLGPYDGD